MLSGWGTSRKPDADLARLRLRRPEIDRARREQSGKALRKIECFDKLLIVTRRVGDQKTQIENLAGKQLGWHG